MKHEDIVEQKIHDTQLRENLYSAMHTLQNNREKLIKNRYSDWEELREKGRVVKENALSTLNERLLEFEENATKNGIKVHWANSPEEANDIVLQIAKDNNIDRILKGKSMASEEIHLNQYMKDKGIDAVETDLGELIIQLIDEPPVHIVVPAIHKNRYEIGEIFESKLGSEKESEPEKLNAIARQYLREEFKTLKMGLSGVNFAVSKAGAMWLIENEGNGRMCTTYPDIHVAICGIEKVVETLDDATVLDTLLIPSATGQPATTYNNIITGPRKEGELDGPKEVHVVLLDNHRTNMLAHEEYKEALNCIRCGACMNYCPVYEKIGGHAYQTVYPGPIGEVISPQLFGMDVHGDVLSFCSLCNRCEEVCPVKIPLAEFIRKLRRDKLGDGKNPPIGTDKVIRSKIERKGFEGFTFIATHGFAFHSGVKVGSLFMPFLNTFSNNIPVLKNWTRYRSMPKIKGDLHKRVKKMEGVSYE